MTDIETSILSFHALLLASAAGLPLLAAAALLMPGLRRIGSSILVLFAALPALWLAVHSFVEPGVMSAAVTLPRMLTGVRFGMDGTSRAFLLFTSALWAIAALYARAYMEKDPDRHRFFLYFLLTMSGNIGLILAQDMVGFYVFFALMTFAAYGLVIHTGSPAAFHAGKIYIIMAVIGEALVIAGMLFAASAAGGSTIFRDIPAAVAASENRGLIVSLVLSGFGVKAGAVPLHPWLPLAHPVAPTPASAVLSGAMIKAGLLGWLRFLPLGVIALPDWGALCMIAGVSAAFYGVIIGLTQNDPKTVLAYSSVSQMGTITLCVGIALAAPAAWPTALPAILMYSLHHGFSKGALFLGAGAAAGTGEGRNRMIVAAGLLLPSLALSGAPFTGGAAAKLAVKAALAAAPGPWSLLLEWLLFAASVGTTVLMGWFLVRVWAGSKTAKTSAAPFGLLLPWALLLAGVAATGWPPPFLVNADAGRRALSLPNLVAALWPVLAGALILWSAWLTDKRRAVWSGLRIPAGDLIELIVPVPERLRRVWRSSLSPVFSSLKSFVTLTTRRLKGSSLHAALAEADDALARWPVAGILFLLLGTALFILLAAQGRGP